MTPAQVVETFWNRMQKRDWAGVRALLANDVVVEWPETNEQFVGADSVVAVNREYPEGWEIRVLRIVQQGNLVVAEVEVPQKDVGVFRTAAFMEVTNGLITRSVEYWVQVGGSEPPAWRKGFVRRAEVADEASPQTCRVD